MISNRIIPAVSLAAALLALADTSSAATVLANGSSPGDTFTNASTANQGQAVGVTGWYYNNVRNGGTAGINISHARSGNGSAQLSGTQGPGGASSKADIEYLAGATAVAGNYRAGASMGLFSALVDMQYDWYRDSTSLNNSDQHPSLRVLIDLDGDLSTISDRGGLVYERVYNGGGAVPTDSWMTDIVGATTNLWNFGFGGLLNVNASSYAYDGTLAEWQSDSRMARALVIGFSSGVGSGWGAFDGAVDNIGWTIGTQKTSTNFEVQAGGTVPEPGTLLLAGASLLGLFAARRRSR